MVFVPVSNEIQIHKLIMHYNIVLTIKVDHRTIKFLWHTGTLKGHEAY